MLEKADIPFEFRTFNRHFQIGYPVLPPSNRCRCSVMERDGGILEIVNGVKNVTAEHAFIEIAEIYLRDEYEHLEKLNNIIKEFTGNN